MSFRFCGESANVAINQCTEWADQGHNECDNWRRDCCDWWPCNWLCEIVSWFCTAWVWVSNIVCVAWRAITLLVCVIWVVVEFLLAPLGALIELIKAIPIIGRFIDFILNIVTTLIWRLIKLPDLFMSLAGVEPVLTVRLCVLVIRSGGVYPTTSAQIDAAITQTRTTLADAANLYVGLDRVVFISEDAPQEAAIVGCGGDIGAESFGIAGSYYQYSAARGCPLGSIGRITGISSRIIVAIVPNVVNSDGCAWGPLNDYLVLPGNNLACLAHEIGHKLGLGHEGANILTIPNNLTNLMVATTCRGTFLEVWQRAWARNSKYASHI